MPRSETQKLKLLYLMKILLENTDDGHGMTVNELISALAGYNIDAERKSIYTDIEALENYGLDVLKEKRGGSNEYYIGSREFEMAELKLLVDSVQSARFLTEKKSRNLIKKLESLTSRHEAGKLHRQVYVQNRVKTMNESIYYNVDDIHEAIAANVQISFTYFEWDLNKNMVLKKNGKRYVISPWGLTQNAENYYLIGYDSDAGIIKHFRVDKMNNIVIMDKAREGKDVFKRIDMASYSNKRFGMFAGEEKRVKIEFEKRYVGVVIDRFGKNINMHKSDEDHFVVNVDVAVSNQFYGWVFGLGDGVKILGPKEVEEDMRRMLEDILCRYR